MGTPCSNLRLSTQYLISALVRRLSRRTGLMRIMPEHGFQTVEIKANSERQKLRFYCEPVCN
jgi:hypothetical protein